MFELMDTAGQSAVIKVIGIGGGGGNAVDHMLSANLEGVEFVKKKVQKHEHRFWVTTLNKIQKGEIDLDNAGH